MSSGAGAIAGGAAKGFGAGLEEGQSLQQGKATAALGAGARQLVGAPPVDQSSSGPLGALGNLFQGQQQAPQAQSLQAAPGVARSPMPQPQPAQAPPQAPPGIARSPLPQPQPSQPMAVPGLAPAQPGVANTGAQQGQASPPPPPQIQVQMPSPPPGAARPQQPTQQLPMGQWDMPGLTQAIIKSRPNISDRELGGALIQGIPTLNAQGLQQFRGAAQQIARERVDIGGFNAETARHRENRLTDWDAGKPAREKANKEADDVLKTAYRKYGPVLNDFNATPADKKAAQGEIDKAEAKAKEIRDKGYAPPAEDSSGESGAEGLPDEADAIAQAKEALQNKGTDKKAVLERLQLYYPGITEQDLQ